MTDEERVEEYIKNEVCIKLCPTWKANDEKCDLFPRCHYISSKIKYYRLGLAAGRKELEKENEELKAKLCLMRKWIYGNFDFEDKIAQLKFIDEFGKELSDEE